MTSFSKSLQKFFVYFFTGVSMLVVILGVGKVKQGDTLGLTPTSGGKGGSGGTGIFSGLAGAVKGQTITAKGKSFQTPWGNLATTIKVKDGKVIAVEIPQLPDSPPSVYAKPYLIDQVLLSGSANIQGVSGATITSRAFIASLESALAQASSQGIIATGASDVFTRTTTATPSFLDTSALETSGTASPATTRSTATVSAGVSGTFTGNAYQTPWGNASASITFANGKITVASMPQVPNSPPSVQAKPYLIDQVLRTGSANIQGVSGATITSRAFIASLESALAQATSRGTSAVPAGTAAPTAKASTPSTAVTRYPASSATTISAGVSGTFTGNAYQTPWGNASASVTFTNGKITAVSMPQVPNSPPSVQAKPYLIDQALAAGGANIQGVSGATYASIAFKSSLESAIAKASAQGTVTAPTATTPTPTVTKPLIPRTYHDDDRDDEDEWDD